MCGKDIRIIELSLLSADQRKALTHRAESDLSSVTAAVLPIIESVRRDGDAALIDCAERFDGAHIAASDLRATPVEFDAAFARVDDEVVRALEQAAENIAAFHRHQIPDGLSLHETHPGVLVGDRWTAIDSVACYVPRGKGSFPSSVLMTAIPARVASVGRIVIITPPGPDGTVDPATLVAARIAGVEEVYKCGGAQGIAAVAYGTETVPRCDKVVGPGSAYVAAAKRLLAPVIDPGAAAGPSELIVFADETASPDLAALELCVESEHGPDSSAFLVTTSRKLAEDAAARVVALWTEMTDLRAGYSRAVLTGPAGGILLAEDAGEAMDFINTYAPEHLSVLSSNAWNYLPAIRHAGEILLGEHSAIAVANFVLGPSHVLPTGGAAKTQSPLSVFDFLKRSSVASVSRVAYETLQGSAETIARYEGFDAHARSITALRQVFIAQG